MPYEKRKISYISGTYYEDPKVPVNTVFRMETFEFQQEYELGKYVADELMVAEGVEEGDVDAPSDLAHRQKMKDGQYARVFFEPSDTDPNAVLSPLYPVKFVYEKRNFASAYQAYEVMRAEELGNAALATKLLGTNSARTMRLLTRDVKGKPPMGHPADAMGLWRGILTAAYTQNPVLQQYLMNTERDKLVYADPRVGPSGVGLAEKDGGVLDPSKWKGENCVGIVLETIRNQLLENTLVDGGVEEATEGGAVTEEQQEKAKVGAIIHAARRRWGGGGRA